MRIVRYSRQGDVGFGILEGDTVASIGPHPFGAFEYTGESLAAGQVRLLAPVLPSKVVAAATTPSTPASWATRSRPSR
jgi:hypothetical protein